jgi:2-(1,2-epoxy-1,2-dihydrophenyl)acetyl-CoA isomerase
MLAQLMPDEPEALALLALMLLHDSRRDAREGLEGDLLVLEEQDRSRWDADAIREGTELVRRALRPGAGPYALQAAIAALHAEASTSDETDWPQIVALYDALRAVAASPVVELNRAVAVAMAEGPERGLELIDPLDGLEHYHLFHGARADLLRRLGRFDKAADAYRRALDLVAAPRDRRYLERRLREVTGRRRARLRAVSEVETSRDGAVQTITLNRPDVLNAFNAAMHRALAAALKDARDPAVRAVVITGAGRGFCVGQDLSEFRESAGDIGDRLRSTYHPNIFAIRALEKPVIAAVNGAAAGAGLSFACACDIRIAADSATFVPAFINVGLVPDSGGTFFIHRLLGYARAFEWMTSGRRLTAAEAHAWGLVSEVVEADSLPGRAGELAAEVAAMPTRGIGWTKRLFDHVATATLEEQLEREAQLQAAATQTDDFREGVAAFLEKRKPRFSGS